MSHGLLQGIAYDHPQSAFWHEDKEPHALGAFVLVNLVIGCTDYVERAFPHMPHGHVF